MSEGNGHHTFNARHGGGSRAFTAADPKRARASFLFYSGWSIILLYLPSGLMHSLLGKGVYGRDVLLFAHLLGSLWWLWRNEELGVLARRHWPLFVPVFIVLPAFIDGNSRVEALTFVKWGMMWMDWIILGYLSRYAGGFTIKAKIFLGLTVLLLASDMAAGTYERVTGNYVLTGDSDERTAFGVAVDLEHQMGDQLRVKGLQRDIFSFANLMGASAVLGLLLFINVSEVKKRLPALLWSMASIVVLLMSGGRSAFFGMLAVGMVTASILIAPQWTRRHFPHILIGWLIVCLTLSAVGVGQIAEAIGGSVFRGASMGSSGSAYERDQNWAGILEAIERVPVVLMFGSPMSSLFDPRVEVFYHWADNQYFWLLYHTGLVGFGAVLWYFWTVVSASRKQEADRPWVFDGLVLFLLYVMGEAIARESLTFIGCLPLFAAIGYYGIKQRAAAGVDVRRSYPAAVTATAKRERRRSSSSSSDGSAVSEMRRRVEARLKEKK